MRRGVRVALLAAASVSVAGCATTQQNWAYYKGNKPDFDVADAAAFADAQATLAEKFIQVAGVEQPASEWRPIVDAGILYADVRCSRFMHALAWFNRVREGTSRQVGYIGSAAGAALALVNAAKDVVGLTPLGFTLAQQTVDNIGQGLLYNMNPGAVQNLVEKQQSAYLAEIEGDSYTSQAAALRAIYGYADLCLPASIEGEVNTAVEQASFTATPTPTPAPTPTPTPTGTTTPPADGDNPTLTPPARPPVDGAPNVDTVPEVRQTPTG